jgi:hypothetical protein
MVLKKTPAAASGGAEGVGAGTTRDLVQPMSPCLSLFLPGFSDGLSGDASRLASRGRVALPGRWDHNPFFLVFLPPPQVLSMLAKKTSKNQITLPKAIVSRFPGVDYFDVVEEDGRIVLVPLRESRADEVRQSLRDLGITEEDVKDAVQWARK